MGSIANGRAAYALDELKGSRIFSHSLENAHEGDVVREDDHLPDQGFMGQALGHFPATFMVERGHRIVKDNASTAFAQRQLREE